MSTRRHEACEALQDAVRRNDLSVIEGLLADDVRWYGNGPGGCHNREQVLATLRAQLEHGIRPLLEEAGAEGDRLLLRVRLSGGRSRPTRTRRFGSRSPSTRRAASSSCRTTRAGRWQSATSPFGRGVR